MEGPVGSRTTSPARRRRDPDGARSALAEAAARLLTQHAPSAISGRRLANEAGVNYGLVHHYFGGKDAALSAGLQLLRDDFIERHGDGSNVPLLGIGGHPYFQAIVRSQVDHPDSVSAGDEFPISSALVRAITTRLSANAESPIDDTDLVAQAKARVLAAVSIQICYSVFGALMLDSIGVGRRDQEAVEQHLSRIYDSLALLTPAEATLPPSYPLG